MKGFFWAARHGTYFACVQCWSRVGSPVTKTVQDKITFLHFPSNLLHLREREKITDMFRQCSFALDNSSLFAFGPGDCSEGPLDAENGLPVVEPHNPRTTPTKTMMNTASAILGVVYILLFS